MVLVLSYFELVGAGFQVNCEVLREDWHCCS